MEDLGPGYPGYPLFQDTSKWIHENVSLIEPWKKNLSHLIILVGW